MKLLSTIVRSVPLCFLTNCAQFPKFSRCIIRDNNVAAVNRRLHLFERVMRFSQFPMTAGVVPNIQAVPCGLRGLAKRYDAGTRGLTGGS